MLPTNRDYALKRSVAATFENQVLYRMCEEFPRHDDQYVTSGKILAIGRIYAASPERGAGGGNERAETLCSAIGGFLKDSAIDEKLFRICDDRTISHAPTYDAAVELHCWFVDQIKICTTKWNERPKKSDWKPRNHVSFASKYLHFHKPNAFPIMDSITRAALDQKGHRGAAGNYKSFCRDTLCYVEARGEAEWYPRQIDTELLSIGRRALSEKRKVKAAE